MENAPLSGSHLGTADLHFFLVAGLYSIVYYNLLSKADITDLLDAEENLKKLGKRNQVSNITI